MSEGNGAVRLNLGCGDNLLEGYHNLDKKRGNDIYPLEGWGNGVADEIRASHILEHFPQREVSGVLKEWARVLMPGGMMKIAVPDFEWVAKQALAGNPNDLPLGGYIMGGQTDEYDFHKSLFNRITLEEQMKTAGLVDIQPWQSEINDCAALPVSLNLMGRKPDVAKAVNGNGLQYVAGAWRDKSKMVGEMVKIRPGVVISRPRYGPLDAAEAIYEIAIGIHAPMFKSLGCWRGPRKDRAIDLALDYRMEWDEGLTDAVEQALHHSDPLDVIVTVDFDTYATPDDAKELIRLLYQNPQYDCVVATQVRRGHYQEILANFAETPDFSQALVPIITGHFGLTVFRRHVFERMRKPWFLSKPDQDGGWGEGRTDADIYFWNHFCDQGFKAALATTVVIGHGDEAVCWPKIEDGKIVKVWQSLTEWLTTRKPPV